jgi:hypothetical protein
VRQSQYERSLVSIELLQIVSCNLCPDGLARRKFGQGVFRNWRISFLVADF